MLSRSQWKKMREVREGLPQGERRLCKCGALLVLEIGNREVIVHHAVPWCEEYKKVIGKAEFLTLSAAPVGDVEKAMAEIRDK